MAGIPKPGNRRLHEMGSETEFGAGFPRVKPV